MEATAMARSLLSPPPPNSPPSLSRPRSNLGLLPLSQSRTSSPPLVSLSNAKISAVERRSSFVARCATDGAVTVEEKIPIEKQFPPFPSVMDINQIREILPHRFPFLLVDRVIEYEPGVTAVGIKNVTINDNFFPGHFPERPIMPGVLMVEVPRVLQDIWQLKLKVAMCQLLLMKLRKEMAMKQRLIAIWSFQIMVKLQKSTVELTSALKQSI